jgi:hypothetical protein
MKYHGDIARPIAAQSFGLIQAAGESLPRLTGSTLGKKES